MRAIQVAILVAILAVLSVIAVDLHRLVILLGPNSPTLVALFGSGAPAGETRAQRDKRIAAEAAESARDMQAAIEGAMRAAREPKRATAKPQN
jgi:hypothetical protein